MWAVVRLLLISPGGKLEEKFARLLLTPSALTAGDNDEYDLAAKTLAELGIVTVAEGTVALTPTARTLSIDDVAGFNILLRLASLDRARNAGLAESDDLGGPKDLVRALAWFLTQDPAEPLDWGLVGHLQENVFPGHLPPPFANSSRWDRFVYWAPALGLAAQPLQGDGTAAKLVPDCTTAVRETVLNSWEKGESVSPSNALSRIIAELPVLPGGAYSQSLGLTVPEGGVSPSLSNALLTGDEAGWITLDRQSDAVDVTFLTGARGARVEVSQITVNGGE
jgi:hypothetical protein